MPKISVIIPVYNAENYLKRCLDSVVNQTLKDIEIICVNDCSTDNSINILNEYAKKYPNMKVIDCKINDGESVARNIGLDNVTGEYLAFVDNDDEIDLDFYEKLYNKAVETNADIVRGEAHYISYNGKSFKNKSYILKTRENKYNFSNDWWCAIYRSELIKKNNIKLTPGLLISADVIFLIHSIIKSNKVETVENIFYHHHDQINSGFSKYLSEQKILSGVKAIEMVLDLLHNNNIQNITLDGYNLIVWEQFKIYLNLHYHNNNISLTQIYAKAMIEFYHSVQNKTFINEKLENTFPLIAKFILNDNLEDLIDILNKYNTNLSFLTANMRYKQHELGGANV